MPRQSCPHRRAERRLARLRCRCPLPGGRPCTPASAPAPRHRPVPKDCRRQWSSCGAHPDRPDTKLRVIDGRYRHKAGNARLLVGAVQLLAGAAFAAHPVARDLRVAPAAVQHHRLHHLPHGGGGGGLDHLPLADRLVVLQTLPSGARMSETRYGCIRRPPFTTAQTAEAISR